MRSPPHADRGADDSALPPSTQGLERPARRATPAARLAAAALLACILAGSGIASADAVIQVRVTDAAGRPTEGRVTLTGQAGTHRCTTTAGRCTLRARGGSYRITLAPARGAAPPPRTVAVPASGTIALTAAAAPARATTAAAPSSSGGMARAPTPSTTPRPTKSVSTRNLGAAAALGRAPRGITGGGAATTPPSVPAGSNVRSATRSSTSLSPSALAASRTFAAGRPSTTGSQGGDPAVAPSREPAAAPSQRTDALAAQRLAARAAPDPELPNLGAGRRLVAQGTVLDRAGRPVDGTLTVVRNGTAIGRVQTTAGRFSIFDVTQGNYTVNVVSSRGTRASRPLRITAGVSRINLPGE